MPYAKSNIFWVKSPYDEDDEFRYSDYTTHWKTSKGDLVRIRLLKTKRKYEYTVALDIGKGKKNKEECLQTGRSGVEGLVAALVMMEELLKNLFSGERLLVYGADKRRYNVYKRYLIPLGFVEIYDGAGKHLVYEKK